MSSIVLISLLIALAGPVRTLYPERIDETDLRRKAFAQQKEGDTEGALRLFESWLEQNPDDIEVLQTVGFIRYRAEDFKESARCFRNVLEKGGEKPYPLFMLGNIAFWEFDLGKALAYYQKVRSLDPEYPSLDKNIRLLDERMNRVKELKRLRLRCDILYWSFLSAAALALLAILAIEWSRFHSSAAG